MHYKVTWTIELDAESPEDAAFMAIEIQKDENSIANHFMVEDESGKRENVEIGSISLKFEGEEEPSGLDQLMELLESLSDAECDEPSANHAAEIVSLQQNGGLENGTLM